MCLNEICNLWHCQKNSKGSAFCLRTQISCTWSLALFGLGEHKAEASLCLPTSQEPCAQQRLGPGGVRVVSSQLQDLQRCHSLCRDRETKCERWEITGRSV